ncbi:short-chain dehydrogenase reductase sdr [Fusarium albosuccineum]|uniref:Short-chain dehydrogenase reductase sdr n=1 Tax=Fusarium albosuccineum TaxID=1237068 RepID=A0A8H4PDG9_9HYPO|nr:short-chain dehydrogenase reductase sdr [Fusarium albosuccineum]
MAPLLSGSAFITGAAQGIGWNTAKAFASHGIEKLALTDIDNDVLTKAVKELQEQYPKVKKTLEKVVEKFGRLDIAVNNADVRGPINDTHEVSEEDWLNLININLNGVWRCQKEELGIFLKQEDRGLREGRGRIINVASMFGLFSPPRGLPHTAYTAAKHGVVGLTKADAVVYGKQKIRINAVCPGVLAQGDATPLAPEVSRSSMGRPAEVEEIADAIAFLGSPLSSFVQGAAFVVHGGFTLT